MVPGLLLPAGLFGYSQRGQQGVLVQGGFETRQEQAAVRRALHQRVCGVPVLDRNRRTNSVSR